LLFNAGCNEQVFSPKPPKFDAGSSCRFQEKRKNAPLILKNDVTKPKARLLQ